jgi:hypothetical protein
LAVYSGESARTVTPMSDARIEAFLADVLALEGEDQSAIREGVHIALADCEEIFKAQELNRRMKEGGPCMPYPVSQSRYRGDPTWEGNSNSRAFEVCLERYRRAAPA